MLQASATATATASSSSTAAQPAAAAAPSAAGRPPVSGSGGAPLASVAPPPAVPGTSGMATSQPVGPSSTPGGWPLDRELSILRKVEELVKPKSRDQRQKDKFIDFLHEMLPSIHPTLFPEYFEHVVRYTRRFVDESNRLAGKRSQEDEDEEEDATSRGSEAGGGGRTRSSMARPSEMGQEDDDEDLTGEVVDPYELPAGPSILGVRSVLRGSSGGIVGYGPSIPPRRPKRRPSVSPPAGQRQSRMGSPPRAPASSAQGSGSYSTGSFGSLSNATVSPSRFQEQFTNFASQRSGCTAMNLTSAASTVTAVACGTSTRTYATLTNVQMPQVPSASSGQYLHMGIQGQVMQGASEPGASFPGFDTLSSDSFPPSYQALNAPRAEPVSDDLNTPQPAGRSPHGED